MRKFKFRAYDKKLKKWVTGNSEGFNLFGECTLLGGVLANEYYCKNVFENLYKDVEVMQYTGLKSKSGIEIYEGDIVRDGVGKLLEIKWDNHHVAFVAGDRWMEYIRGYGNSGNPFYAGQGEVIGNIYENPELLKEI